MDSSIVFCCIKNDNEIHKPYLQRRLNKIREVMKDFLKLIPSKMNPADNPEDYHLCRYLRVIYGFLDHRVFILPRI